MRRSAVRLVVLEALAPFGDGRLVSGGDPPQAVAGFVHFSKPLGAVSKHLNVAGLVSEVAQSRGGFPYGHVHDHEWIVVVGDVRGVSGRGLQPPDKAGGLVRHGVYRCKLGHKFGDLRVVDGRDQSRDIDLRQLVEHQDSPKRTGNSEVETIAENHFGNQVIRRTGKAHAEAKVDLPFRREVEVDGWKNLVLLLVEW